MSAKGRQIGIMGGGDGSVAGILPQDEILRSLGCSETYGDPFRGIGGGYIPQ